MRMDDGEIVDWSIKEEIFFGVDEALQESFCGEITEGGCTPNPLEIMHCGEGTLDQSIRRCTLQRAAHGNAVAPRAF